MAQAAHYRRPQSFGDMVLTDRGFATGVNTMPEIAQFQLGDLTFKVHYPHCTYTSILGIARQVLVLSDICSTISTPVLICPVPASMSQLSSDASIRSIQNRLSGSLRICTHRRGIRKLRFRQSGCQNRSVGFEWDVLRSISPS